MAQSTARRRRTSRVRPKSSRGHYFGFFRSRRFWLLMPAGFVVGTMAFFSESVFEALGFGIIIFAVWLVIVVWTVRTRRVRRMAARWNIWLGAMLLTGAVLGIMAQYHPPIHPAGANLEEASLSGSLGDAIAGGSHTWARLLVLILIGTVCAAPAPSMQVAGSTARNSWKWAKPRMASLASVIGKGAKRTSSSLITWIRRTAAAPKLPRLLRQRHPAPSPIPAISQPAGQIPAEEAKASPAAPARPATAPPPPDTGEQLPFEDIFLPGADRELPPIEILDEAPKADFAHANDDERARLIENALASYGVEVSVRQINPGPSVTQFGVEPGWARKYKKVPLKNQDGKPVLDKEGNPTYRMEEVSKTRVKVDRITALANDLALALAVSDIRIEAPVPGKPLVGIEVPNVSTAIVSLRGVIESAVFKKAASKSRLAIALGQGSGGDALVGDLAKMPHLLIAGATGSGKTVCLNCIVTCLLTQTTPHEVRFILIDPKRVEMVNYGDVPHLLTPVVVDSDKAVEALRRITLEMDNRYKRFASVGVRNIDAYNKSPRVAEPMPYIVVIIDELADLMMTTPDVVEPLICRLAQLARATGIHLVVATQRPSVDVITGLIKANFPTRISFAVVSSIDSRTILDTVGAEKLLGKGDMLYIPPEASKPKRIRGCYVSDEEIERVVSFWKEWAAQHLPPGNDTVAQEFAALSVAQLEVDPFLDKARQLADEVDRLSISLLQRRLHIGYQRAARIMEQLKEEGLADDDDEFRSPWEGDL